MEIVWYGLSSFRLTERGNASVVTDPYADDFGYIHPRPKSDVVTISYDEATRNNARAVRSAKLIITSPGEYEIGDVFITGISVSSENNKKAQNTRRNNIYLFSYDSVNVCHLGGLGHLPKQSDLDALGNVDVLLTPVGGGDLLSTSEVIELISMIQPRLIIPMHFHTTRCRLKLPKIDTFLQQMGGGRAELLDSVKVTASSLPSQSTVIIPMPVQPAK
ncbi:MAG: MBL fold metallo-hydrolase [Chloroflexota bacterium]